MSYTKDYEGELITFGGFPVGIKLDDEKKKKKKKKSRLLK